MGTQRREALLPGNVAGDGNVTGGRAPAGRRQSGHSINLLHGQKFILVPVELMVVVVHDRGQRGRHVEGSRPANGQGTQLLRVAD